MAIRGVSLSERETFILPNDPGHPDHPSFKAAILAGTEPEAATKFFIGNLTQGCRIELGDMVQSPIMRDGGVTMEMKNTKRSYAVVQRGLIGWENMLDSEGKVVKFELGTVQTASGFVKGAADACMAHLSSADIFEIAKKILEKNGLSKAVAGNSEGASPLSPAQLSPVGVATIAPSNSNESEVA